MELSHRQLALALTASTAYLGWYAHRQWTVFQRSQQARKPLFRAVQTAVLDSHTAWDRFGDAFLTKVKSSKVLAIDFHWQDVPLQAPAIVGLSVATSAQEVTFVRLSEFSLIPEDFENVLRDPGILKVGVGIVESATALGTQSGIELQGCIDLRYVAMKTPDIGRKLLEVQSDLSLTSIAHAVLGLRIADDEETRGIEWVNGQLPSQKIHSLTERAVNIFELAREICREGGTILRLIGLLRTNLWLENCLRHEFGAYVDVGFQLERVTSRSLPVKSYALVTPSVSCVVCATRHDLRSTHVVPEEYRMNSAELEGTVILCVDCGSRFESSEDLLRLQLEEFFSAPLVDPSQPFVEDEDLKQIRQAANLLRQRGNELPEARRKALEALLKNEFNVNELDEEITMIAASMEYRVPNINLEFHGSLVRRCFPREKLRLLDTMCRENFVVQMEPVSLPESFLTEESLQILSKLE